MDTSTTEVIKNSIGSAVRALLYLVAGILVKKGIITSSQGDTYVAQALPVVIGGIMALATLIWGIYQKKHASNKVDVALSLPAGTTREVLEKKV